MNYNKERIDLNDDKMFSMPTIKGTMVTLRHILQELSQGKTKEDILNSNHEITIDDIHACLEFASEAVNQVKETKKVSNLTPEEQTEKERLKESLFGKYGKFKKE